MDKRTPDEVIASMNAERERRKQRVEQELYEIQIDELVENAITKGSWFRENFNLAPESSSFWSCLPRYVRDCVKLPAHVSPTVAELAMQLAIQKYRSKFK